LSTPASSRSAAKRRLAIVRVPEGRDTQTFAQAVRGGLTTSPKTLPCHFLYDAAGSDLFERICDLPEYYLTRTEDAILREYADEMVSGWRSAPTLIELGSGSSTKTRRLIGAMLDRYEGLHYVPIDVSPTILEDSARSLARDFPSLRVTGLAGDYRGALGAISRRFDGPKCLVFLGSSLGNYDDDEALSLLALVARAMGPADRLLLGTDLAKDRAVLEAAYDDAQGVSAAFNRNILGRINRDLGGHFDPELFTHQARYRPERGRVEMHLVSRVAQDVCIEALGVEIPFAEGEAIHTESSHKYTIERLASLADRAGLVEEASWSDPQGWFRVQRWKTIP
jgi:L-histidine N-alpha-methyltransferase